MGVKDWLMFPKKAGSFKHPPGITDILIVIGTDGPTDTEVDNEGKGQAFRL